MDQNSKNSASAQNRAFGSSLSESLVSALNRNHLGHAMLFCVGDESAQPFVSFLREVFASILCLNRKETLKSCQQCESCLLFKDRELREVPHPDATWLESDTQKGYSVEAIRDLSHAFQRAHSFSPNRVAWLPEADLLSASGGAAANALLKLLEEPRPRSYLMMSTSRPDGVLPTLRSRSQIFRLPQLELSSETVEEKELLTPWKALSDWLRSGASSPLKAELPADSDSFWSERDTAIRELEKLHLTLWTVAKAILQSGADRELGLRLLDFFSSLQTLIRNLRNFGNPALQWLSFRSDARLGL